MLPTYPRNSGCSLSEAKSASPRLWVITSTLHLLLLLIFASPAIPQEPQEVDERLALERLQLIEDRQRLLVESAERDLGRLYIIFGATSAFFGLLIVFHGIRSIFEERRRHNLDAQHLTQIQAMMGSFQDNVSTINSLISALRQTFDVQADVTKNIKTIDDRLRDLDAYREREELAYRSQVDAVNVAAADAFRASYLHQRDRDSFKTEENRILLKSVADRLDTLGLTGDLTGLASPVSSFVSGLARFNEMQYREAVDHFLAARDLAKQQLTTPLSQYGTWDKDEIQRNLRILIDETYYHLGIIHYNTGDWERSKEEFAIAYERHPLDFRSRIYIPEMMFFDNATEPRATEAEYRAVEEELRIVVSEKRVEMKPSWEWCLSSFKLRQGNIYIKKLFPPPNRNPTWRGLENPKTALECFWEAHAKQPQSAVGAFSLAQAMWYDGKSPLWEDRTPEELFREAFFSFRNQTILKTEPILLTMLYYCCAISCHGARIPSDSPSTYLGLARQQLQRVPESILVFSPLNKIMVGHDDLLREMDELEKWWQRSAED